MIKKGDEKKLFSLIKLISYVIISVLIILSTNQEYITILIILISLLISNSFIRQLYIQEKYGRTWYGKVSILFELAIIVLIGIYDNSMNYFFYYFFVTISETTIVYSKLFSIPVTSFVIITNFLFIAIPRDFINIPRIIGMSSSLVMAHIFTYIMSYMAKIQIKERMQISKVNKELERAYKKLIENASNVEELAIEKERNRMAREIHDTLAHTLTAVIVQLQACKKLVDISPEKAKIDIEKAQNATRNGLSDVKRTIKALRPQLLDGNNFFEAVKNLILDINNNTDTTIKLIDNTNKQLFLSKDTEVSLFRVIQESITNSIRHGLSSKVCLLINNDNNILSITIQDNGTGCNHITKGFGLEGIKERIHALKGLVSYHSSLNEGFKTEIKIPLDSIQKDK